MIPHCFFDKSTTDSTHCTYPWKDGQAELSWVVYLRMVTHLSTKLAQSKVTLLTCATLLVLS